MKGSELLKNAAFMILLSNHDDHHVLFFLSMLHIMNDVK